MTSIKIRMSSIIGIEGRQCKIERKEVNSIKAILTANVTAI